MHRCVNALIIEYARRGRQPGDPLARSALGSLSEGAGSPNGLTEGVSFVERSVPTFLRAARMPPLPGAVETGGWRVAKLATPTNSEVFGDFHSTNRSVA